MSLANMLRHVFALIIPAETNHAREQLTILRNTHHYVAEADNGNTTAAHVGVLPFAFVKKAPFAWKENEFCYDISGVYER
jgi:hypothetical protein